MTLTIEAPAKINLTLEVIGKRPDGYHEIRSVIQTLKFYDSLLFTPGKEVKIKSATPGWVAEQSLVAKTVKLLQDTTRCTKGVNIEVMKRIPLMSGLGGDSSDAAAVLRGLNQLWDLKLSQDKLQELAEQLGSDVAFFLYGGTALMEGRGEIITLLPSLPHRWVILIIPNLPRMPGKTREMYGRLQPYHYTDGGITEKLLSDLKAGKDFKISTLFNTFENVAFTRGAELTTYQSHIRKIGAANIHLAGTGPTLFILLDNKPEAEDLLLRLKNQGMKTYLTETR